ncbi:glycerol-3-phosphate 1-O-acyltransferase PlsY [Nibricoccus sp. IMCC34717]|uniref:glycerol-3-phosphate 1-O-acyltransferase PlsY n=1 Tax=Nibricoccus sp. IMCC34717 TaxID=3034021 RepID=UPI00384F5438
MTSTFLLSVLVGYLLGALPFGYWVAKAKGINIFEHGSKNPGATNVRRVLGKGPGNLVFALDAAKGAVATGWPRLFVDERPELLYCAIVGLIAALIGHSFSCFTGFRGGKGVATASGGFVVLMPLALLASLGVWLVTFYSSRYVSLASILAALALPVAAFFLRQPQPLVVLAALIAVFVVVRHRANIVRLVKGTENRFTKKEPEAASPKS